MADYTEEQLRQAARNAYQAGDVAAAQRLIAQARLAAPATPAPQGGSSVNQENLSIAGRQSRAALQGFGNGASLGFNDEVSGAVAGVGGVLSGRGFAEPYSETRDAIRSAKDVIQQAHPVAYGVGEVAGALPASAAGGALATGGKTALQQGIRLSGMGAIEGGILGAGNADGDGLVEGATQGAALGAALGGAAKPVADGLRATGRAMATPVSGLFNAATGRGSQTRANAIAQRALERSGKSLEEVQGAAMQALEAGQPMAVADLLGSPGQGALTGVARQPGQAQRELTEFLESRQLNASDRMSQALADSLGATDTAAQRQASLTATRSATANTNYDAAREGAKAVDVRGALGVLDTRLGQTAGMEGTGFTGDGIDSAFSRYRNRLAADRVPSDVDSIELSDFDRVLGVKQDLQDDIEAATRAGRNNEARELRRVVGELDKALEVGSDGYRQANDTFAQQSRTIDAVGQGVQAARPGSRADDSIQQFSGMNSDQQGAFRAGLGDQLIGKLENQAPGANVALPLMRDRTSSLLDAVAKNPEDLQARIARENVMNETRNRALGGSRTADNLANMDDVQNVDVGFMANLLRNPREAAVQAGQKAANVATNQTEGTNQLLARMLMSQNPQQAFSPVMAQENRRQMRSVGMQALLRQLGHNYQGSM